MPLPQANCQTPGAVSADITALSSRTLAIRFFDENCSALGERERGRDRQTDRQTDRQRKRQTDRQTDRQREKDREKKTERERQTEMDEERSLVLYKRGGYT